MARNLHVELIRFTYNCGLQFRGRIIRLPSFKYDARHSTGIDGYGMFPSVTISYSKTPYDQLVARENEIVIKYSM